MNIKTPLEQRSRNDAKPETEPVRSALPTEAPSNKPSADSASISSSRLRAFADPSPDQFSAVFATRSEATSELLLLPDGRILAHHLTPELATVLHAATAQH